MRSLTVFVVFILHCFAGFAQSLSFTAPQNIVPAARSDNAISIAAFDHHYFLTWKDTGSAGNIHIGTLPAKDDSFFVQKEYLLKHAVTQCAPVLLTTAGQCYLFWITAEGKINYLVSATDTGFNQSPVNTLTARNPITATIGLCAAVVDGKILIATHASQKGRLSLLICEQNTDGTLTVSDVTTVKRARSNVYPSIAAINNGTIARIVWTDHITNTICYADYTPSNRSWLPPQTFGELTTKLTPALYQTTTSGSTITIWKDHNKIGRLSYSLTPEENTPDRGTILPEYFSTNFPVSITSHDTDQIIVAFAGTDDKLYVSHAFKYNPASWIGDILLPLRNSYTLKDIVIPGAHDAGMSILNGVGGPGGSTINDCNTLTQVLSVEKQLNAGIRMFDLRIGQYKGELYAKHAPSDCMDEAVAGGYGEKLRDVLNAVKKFLNTNEKEFVILSFCHFCEQHISLEEQAKAITDIVGEDKLFYPGDKKLQDITINDISGKVIVTFENHAYPKLGIDSNTMTEGRTDAFINYRREYAATNQLDKLVLAQKTFFSRLKGSVSENDLIRLDWQLTQNSDEAALICNDFESAKSNPILDGIILLTNTINKNKSIRDLSYLGSLYLQGKVIDWINTGTINKENKPNILYVDVAGTWITDFCIGLNNEKLYGK
ncbi:MAG: phosphatidylinositol-specific phospholipase C domain-containing protein [Taibaiella sp.]|jgi:hypothetical protein